MEQLTLMSWPVFQWHPQNLNFHIALKNGLHCQTLGKQSNKKTAYPDSLPWMGLSRHEMGIDTRNLILFY